MFTGLIREVAKVESFNGKNLKIQSAYKPKIGDSIAINGVCLTVTKLFDNGFEVDVAAETKRIIPKEKFLGRVHIEPAMKLSDRVEGHILQGHVDTIGTIRKIIRLKDGIDFFIALDPYYIKYIVPKGSIAIDGVSLTVNEVFEKSFRVTIIPHTFENTLFKSYKIGSKVNIETDFFARYIEHILKHQKPKNTTLTWQEIDGMSLSF